MLRERASEALSNSLANDADSAMCDTSPITLGGWLSRSISELFKEERNYFNLLITQAAPGSSATGPGQSSLARWGTRAVLRPTGAAGACVPCTFVGAHTPRSCTVKSLKRCIGQYLGVFES